MHVHAMNLILKKRKKIVLINLKDIKKEEEEWGKNKIILLSKSYAPNKQ